MLVQSLTQIKTGTHIIVAVLFKGRMGLCYGDAW